MRIVTKEEAAVRLGVHLNTVVNYLQRHPAAGVRDRKISRAMLVDIDRLAAWMREAMPDKYGDLVIDERELPLEQLGQTVHVVGAGPQVAEPIEVDPSMPVGYDATRVVGRLDEVSLVRRDEAAMLDLLWPKAQIEVARRYRWWVRLLVAGIILAGAAVGGMGWFLSQARTLADERAGQIAVAGVVLGRMEMEVESVGRRADRLEVGLGEAVAGRVALGVELVEMVAEKGRLELLVSQGEDVRRVSDSMILEMSGRIEELEREKRKLATEGTENAEEDGGRIDVAVNLGKDN